MRALRAFEAAARLGGFTAAAIELAVTQSAISHSIRELEARLEAQLFLRRGRSVDLTDAGKRYAPFVREALARLAAGDLAVADPDRSARILTVSVSPSFAAKWLAPRVGAFAAAHPDLDLRISAAARHIDFAVDEIDIAVRHGVGDWPALSCTRLCGEMLVPACSPAFAASRKIEKAGDLVRAPLIHHRDAGAWASWIVASGLDPGPQASRGLVFNEMSLAIDAAVSGQGIALVRTALAAADLAAGRLVIPAGAPMPVDFAYWIVHPAAHRTKAKIKRFRAWLLAEAAIDEKLLDESGILRVLAARPGRGKVISRLRVATAE